MAQDSQLGVVAAAWLNGVSVRAGEPFLLGYVAEPTGVSANSEFGPPPLFLPRDVY
jgi:hypothetical protein